MLTWLWGEFDGPAQNGKVTLAHTEFDDVIGHPIGEYDQSRIEPERLVAGHASAGLSDGGPAVDRHGRLPVESGGPGAGALGQSEVAMPPS
jgi:hypothetical protein